MPMRAGGQGGGGPTKNAHPQMVQPEDELKPAAQDVWKRPSDRVGKP